MTTETQGAVINGKHVLFALFGLFGIVIAVNVVFVTLALGTFTGVTTVNPYQEGLAYNQVLAARHAQRDLGWKAAIDYGGADDGNERVTVALNDAAGRPVTGLALSGSLKRPTQAGMDQDLTWEEAVPGRYQAALALPARGNWDLVVSAVSGIDRFEMRTRLWFK
jgi:nitrogen fixation protein FixH